MAHEQEKEIKLVSTTEDREKLFRLPLFQDTVIAGSRHTYKLVNRYYDTADRRLTKAGMAYRIRETDGRELEATVKTRGKTVNGFSQRGEYTQPVTKAEPMLTGFSDTIDRQLEAFLAGAALEPLFTVTVTRELALLQVSPVTVVELSVDMGRITAGGKEAPIDEIELELKQGMDADLVAYTAALAQEILLLPEEKSKFRRGMELLGYKNFKDAKDDVPVFSGQEAPDVVWRTMLQYEAALCLDLLKAEWEGSRPAGLGNALKRCRALWLMGRPFLPEGTWLDGKGLLADGSTTAKLAAGLWGTIEKACVKVKSEE